MQRTVMLMVVGVAFVAACDSTDPLGTATSPTTTAALLGPPPTTYTARATVIETSINLGLGTFIQRLGDAPPLPPTGGSTQREIVAQTLPGILSVGALSARTSGLNDNTLAVASVGHLLLTVGADTISTGTLSSNAIAHCINGVPTVFGGVTIGVLIINGQVTALTGTPNQVIDLPGGIGRLIVDEQIPLGNGGIDVSALHLTGAGLIDIRIDHTVAAIHCGG